MILNEMALLVPGRDRAVIRGGLGRVLAGVVSLRHICPGGAACADTTKGWLPFHHGTKQARTHYHSRSRMIQRDNVFLLSQAVIVVGDDWFSRSNG